MTQTNSAGRALQILKLLKGHSITGLSNKEIADSLNESASNISRALAVLVGEGLVIKLHTGRYAHSVQMLQIATAHANEIAKAQDRFNELNQRVLAGSI